MRFLLLTYVLISKHVYNFLVLSYLKLCKLDSSDSLTPSSVQNDKGNNIVPPTVPHHHQPNHRIYYFFSRNKKIMEKINIICICCACASLSISHENCSSCSYQKNLLNIRMRRKNRLFSPFAKISHLLLETKSCYFCVPVHVPNFV